VVFAVFFASALALGASVASLNALTDLCQTARICQD
jgi:hypothetical protein